jgi:DNA-3-methyladenine glycosylase II
LNRSFLLSDSIVTQPGSPRIEPISRAATTTTGGFRASHSVSVLEPYRLDLTVSVLRRLSANLVDVLTRDGEYVRWVGGSVRPEVVRVRQRSPGTLGIEIEGDRTQHPRLLALVKCMLGVDVDLARFYRSASRVQWLNPLVLRMCGVKPPRYPTLWEACINAIVFQQISLVAASAIMNRLVALGQPLERDGIRLYRAPSPELFQGGQDALLRAAGLSIGKLATLRRVAEALESGTLDVTRMEELPSRDVAALLRGIKGIGPWTAAVILLRGLGRLDVFPANDTSVARNLALVGGPAPIDAEKVLQTLGPERGMLYYHLLLGRLEARDALISPSQPPLVESV